MTVHALFLGPFRFYFLLPRPFLFDRAYPSVKYSTVRPRVLESASDGLCIHSLHAVSLVDGYNLPMRIDNNKGCGIPSCPVDLGPGCKRLDTLHRGEPVT